MQLQGKRIIVTGGARGIGAGVVHAYAAEGAHIASLDVLDESGEQVAAEATRKGPGMVRFYHCDISIRSEVQDAFDMAVRDLMGLDVLANIAGVERVSPAEAITDQDLDLILNVNVKGTVYTNQSAFRYMRDHGGRIINFGSAAGLNPFTNGAHYSASKGAVHSWTRTVAHEWGKYGIAVNAMAPAIWTPMYDEHRARMSPKQLQAHDAAMARHVPLGGRLGDLNRDFAPVMVFMASEGARFITGQIIPVDGGACWTR
ncbi:MAG: SDR family NAD(P)-dependent oxidoreductase [Dehalococcoidia bacterium]